MMFRTVLRVTPFLLLLLLSTCTDKSKTIHTDTDSSEIKKDTISKSHNAILSNTGLSVFDFIPANYELLDSVSGDLNTDDILDKIIILKKINENSTSDVNEHPEKRPFIILLGLPDGSYKSAVQNDNCILCVDCGGMMGDPYQTTMIDKGSFTIHLYGGSTWRWVHRITFQFDKVAQTWYMSKDETESFHVSEPEKITYKLKTVNDFGKIDISSFDIYSQ